jgi:hypothetical protein
VFQSFFGGQALAGIVAEQALHQIDPALGEIGEPRLYVAEIT